MNMPTTPHRRRRKVHPRRAARRARGRLRRATPRPNTQGGHGRSSSSEPVDLLLTDLRLGGESGMDLIDQRAVPAQAAGLPHDDRLRLGRHRRRGDAPRRLALRHQAAQPRRGRDAAQARRPQPQPRDRRTASSSARSANATGLDRLIGKSPAIQRVFETDRAGRPDPRHRADRGRKRHRQGTRRPRHPPPQRPAGRKSWSSSTAPRSRRNCWKASSSATRRAPSPGPASAGSAASSRPTAAPCSSTRSAKSTPPPRSSCCASCQRAHHRAGRLEHPDQGRRPPASPPPTRTSRELVDAGDFREDLYLPPQRGAHRHAAAARAAARTSCCWPAPSSRSSPRRTARPVKPLSDEALAPAARLPVARQRPRTAHRDRARRGDEQRRRSSTSATCPRFLRDGAGPIRPGPPAGKIDP